ncbi:MAG: Putative transposase, partial [uncultured Chloroflexia bacterium]
EAERVDRRAVGAAASAPAAAEAPHRPPREGAPDRARRHPLGLAHGQSVALPARALRLLEDGLLPLLPLATRRGLGPGPGGVAAPRRRQRTARLEPALRRQHGRPGAPARGGRQRGDPATEALGRSRGGFTTKVHLRCERGGKPMVFVL